VVGVVGGVETLWKAMDAGATDVTIHASAHTTAHPDGQIRGSIDGFVGSWGAAEGTAPSFLERLHL
jgi:hypothetical protein